MCNLTLSLGLGLFGFSLMKRKKIERKKKTPIRFEPTLRQETDFLSVALTTRPQCLVYYTLVAHGKPESWVPRLR